MLVSLYLWLVFITIVVLVLGMKILSWNCRGAGSAPTVRALKALVHKESPDIIFISESKAKSPRVEKIKECLKFRNCYCVNAENKSGGLALYWVNGVSLEVIYDNKNIIACLVYSDPPSDVWLLLLVYGPPKVAHREAFWELVTNLIESFSGPWMMLGDCNSYSSRSDKCGGSSRGDSSSKPFRNFLSNAAAIELGFHGPQYTWVGRRSGGVHVRIRLDQGCCNQEWQEMFPKAGIKHLTAPTSDHKPILLDTHFENNIINKPFRFEAMWARDPECEEVVDQAWSKEFPGSYGFNLMKKIAHSGCLLSKWNKSSFGQTRTKILEIERRIDVIQSKPPCLEALKEEASLMLELEEWQTREEIRLKQKSRELWLKEGDRNSKFFHASTLIRRRRNNISEIKLENGGKIFGRENIEKYFGDHFSELFSSSNPSFPADLEKLIEPCISAAENAMLLKIPSEEEIQRMIFEMNPLKAPGPDGMPGLFFKKFWHIVRNQLIRTVQSFFRDGWMLKEMNETFITLIPKVQGAHKFGHFRPISLCNFCYKVISRILVARLRPLLDKLIDPAQTAFVPNRNIAENVLLAQEVVHSFSTTKKKKGFVGLKLDFQKAYDRVEWPFLIQVLKNFGFHQKFIHLIYQCISTVSFTLLLNGGKGPRIMPSRGLRQGDPLSPYLFIIGSEVLARMINRCSAQRLINGIRIAPSIAGISKLFYADDVLLVCKAKHSEINEIMNILGKYCDWSGQQINFEKSGVFASKGVHSQFLNQLKNQRGLKKLSQGTKYLGVPLFLSSSKKKDFTYLKESLEAKVSNWKSKSLSWMGRATLVKSIALATPIYAMSCFLIPKSLCEEMDSLLKKFWWSPSKSSNRYFTPLAWDNLCQPKYLGGLGFRHFSDTNLALLSKIAWWILIQSNKPCVQALIAKYRVRRNWLDADPSKKASWTWKSVESARHILMAGACKQVNNGESILTWEDPWVPDLPNYKPVPLSPDKLSSCLVVSQILSPDNSRWDESKLYDLFTVESAMAIMRIPVKVSHRVDKWVWVKSHNGKLSVKSAYKELLDLSEPNESDQVKSKIWKSKIHDRLKMVLWRVASDILPTKEKLARFFPAMDPKCPLCDASPESSLHLFVYCHAARFLWAGNEWGCRPDALQFDCPGQFIKFLLSPQVSSHGTFDKEGFLLFGALVLENLWFARNQAIHKGSKFSPNKEIQVVLKKFFEHRVALTDVPLVLPRPLYSWIRPEQGAVKINCDAAVGLDHSVIAIVARDWRGDLIFSMSKRVKTNIPIQAEAEAINLATCVAVKRGFEFVVVESDAKACIDALKVPFDEVPWRISSITADTLLLAFHGKKFIFRWSPRESNKAAHVLASWCLGKNVSGCFGQGYAPSPFLDVINSDRLAAVAAA